MRNGQNSLLLAPASKSEATRPELGKNDQSHDAACGSSSIAIGLAATIRVQAIGVNLAVSERPDYASAEQIAAFLKN